MTGAIDVSILFVNVRHCKKGTTSAKSSPGSQEVAGGGLCCATTCRLVTVPDFRSYLDIGCRNCALQPDVQAPNKAGRDFFTWIGHRLRPACFKPVRRLHAHRNALWSVNATVIATVAIVAVTMRSR